VSSNPAIQQSSNPLPPVFTIAPTGTGSALLRPSSAEPNDDTSGSTFDTLKPMAIRAHGKMHGKRIDLEEDPGLPDGASVEIIIEAPSVSSEQRRQRLADLAGVWADDASLDKIFDEIISDRLKASQRSIDFDAAS
jgi:hypothetical protein